MAIAYTCARCGRIGIPYDPRDPPPQTDDPSSLDDWFMPDELERELLGICRGCQTADETARRLAEDEAEGR